MKDLLYRLFGVANVDRVVWNLPGNSLRILCYHGLCADGLAREPWVPSYFVTQSAFERQLQYLQRHATVLPLTEAVGHLVNGSLPARAVCLTFDDGYQNNVVMAQPLLKAYGMSATVFLATAYIESGEWYPFVKLKLIRYYNGQVALPDYKSSPVDAVIQASAEYWPALEPRLTDDQRTTLRPMTVADVRRADSALIDFGAHSHTHGIARNESVHRRRQEVSVSIRKVSEWTGHPVTMFSYPNGEAGDFGEPEKATMRAEGIQAAVTGMSGANRRAANLFELRRYPMTLYHDDWRFRAEVTGFRSLVRSAAGPRHA